MKDIEYGQDCVFAFSHYTKIDKISPDIVNWKIKAIKYNERVEKRRTRKYIYQFWLLPKQMNL